MGKQVIIAKCLEDGRKVVFEDLEAASAALGVSVSAVSLAGTEGRVCAGWLVRRVERVYAVQTSVRMDWVVATEGPRGYVEYGNPVRVLGRKEVGQVKELTLAWYL